MADKPGLPTPEQGHTWTLRLCIQDYIGSYSHTPEFSVKLDLFQYDPARDEARGPYQQAWDGLMVETRGWVGEYGATKGQRVISSSPWRVEMGTKGNTSVHLDLIEEWVRSLRYVERGLRRIEEQTYERPASFGAFVARVMRVLGIRYLIEVKPKYGEMWKSGERHRQWSASDAADYINSRMQDWLLAEQQTAVG